MQKHTHRWWNRVITDNGESEEGEWPDHTVTVWWQCRCGAQAVHSHTFRPPSVQSEQLEADAPHDLRFCAGAGSCYGECVPQS